MKVQHLKLIFWQNFPSIHQHALMQSLTKHPHVEVYCAYEEDLPVDRQRMGWLVPDFGKARLMDVRKPDIYAELLGFNESSSFHFLSGYFSLPIAWRAFHILRKSEAHIGIISEAFNFFGFTGWLRLQRARYYTLRWHHVFKAILPMGKLGTSFFRQAGFSKNEIHEFAYFVEETDDHALALQGLNDEPFQILYVGQLIPRKRVDLLLKALQSLINYPFQLNIVGDGSERSSLEILAKKMGLKDKTVMWGNQSQQKVQELMQKADLLVLPSRWDGWGAVINEALMAGTPAICSDRCGAATLLQYPDCGHVFKSGNVTDLSKKLNQQLNKGKITPMQRDTLRLWSSYFQPDRGADYLLEIVHSVINQSPQPIVPWDCSNSIFQKNSWT